MSGVSNELYRAWVEVDPDALRANFLRLRERAGALHGVVPVVKADAYGLGAERVVAQLAPLDPWGFAVATADEGRALRSGGYEGRILVVAPLAPGTEAAAVASDLIVTLSDLDGLLRLDAAAADAGRPCSFHVEVDTGIGRAGFADGAAASWAAEVASRARDGFRWSGLCTHFQAADEADPGPSRAQWLRFGQALDAVRGAVTADRAAGVGAVQGARGSGPFGLLLHAANSAAAVRFPEYGLDLARPGFGLYGGWPPALDSVGPEVPRPEPVVAVRARVALVRWVEAGTTLGYGATHVAPPGGARWATLPIGYADGVPRSLGNRGRVLVHGRSAPIVGRVSMDLTVVDVSEIEGVAPGDVATLVGRDGGEEIPLGEVASSAGTIGYEILTGLAPRLPRVEADRVGEAPGP